MHARAYYNEIDPFAAEWLRQLIAAGHIATGDVDTRSIVDVTPADLRGYTQCHFFAGIGVWSRALRRAGWADDRPVWTGSCPCQPFSAAGKGAGFDDERHLWPHFHWLIENCRPAIVFGEQVASKDGLAWLDLVQADLEGAGYASGALDTCAAGFGAPHIRQRLYWVGLRGVGLADAYDSGLEGRKGAVERTAECAVGQSGLAGGVDDSAGARHSRSVENAEGDSRDEARMRLPSEGCGSGGVGNPECIGSRRDSGASVGAEGRPAVRAVGDDAGPSSSVGRLAISDHDEQRQGRVAGSPEGEGIRAEPGGCGVSVWLANADSQDRSGRGIQRPGKGSGASVGSACERPEGLCQADAERPGATNGFWRDPDWLFCRDGKWRPVRPGTSPLVDGAPARVGRLRGYGNAINAEQAQAFVEAVMDVAA